MAAGFMGVALTATAWALAAAGPTITGARRVAWIAPDGEPIPRQPEGELYPWDGCDMQDIRVSSLRFDDAVYTVCEHPTRVPHGGLGRIRAADLASGRAIGEIRWPAPEDLPLAYVAGIAPGPDGRLAWRTRVLPAMPVDEPRHDGRSAAIATVPERRDPLGPPGAVLSGPARPRGR